MPRVSWTSLPGFDVSRLTRWEADISTFTRLIFAAYFLEAGLILIVAPWSGLWERNAFARTEAVAALLGSPLVRGAVSGVGFITALAGLAELAGVFMRRSPAEAQEPQPPHPNGP